ncbi:hypothetical protein B0H14DRAFT_2566250 [Mycena olivaceomarginata]|nr:hypothetical protein B0H14DRAFT_2566250 [Mycena olivaceomarginata]
MDGREDTICNFSKRRRGEDRGLDRFRVSVGAFQAQTLWRKIDIGGGISCESKLGKNRLDGSAQGLYLRWDRHPCLGGRDGSNIEDWPLARQERTRSSRLRRHREEGHRKPRASGRLRLLVGFELFARNAVGKKEFFEERALRVMRQRIARGGYTTGNDSASASRGLGLNEGKTAGYLEGKEGEGRPTAEPRLVERESEGLNSVLDSWDKDAIRACRWAIASQTAVLHVLADE